MDTTRVVADHAAHIGAAAGGHIRSEHEAAGTQEGVELVEGDSGLDSHPALSGIELQNTVEVLGEVDVQRSPHRLPCEARSGAAGDQGDTKIRGDLHHLYGVLHSPGKRDAHRIHRVDACICAVQHPGDVVQVHLPVNPVAQSAAELRHIPLKNIAL